MARRERSVIGLGMVALVVFSFLVGIVLANEGRQEQEVRVKITSGFDERVSRWEHISHEEGIPADTPLFINILLKQENLNELDALFWQANDPKSVYFGVFATKEQIDSIVSPPKSVFELLRSWINSESVSDSVEIQEGADFIHLITTVEHASKLFQTEFAYFHHPRTNSFSVGNLLDATIPSSIAQYVDFIVGVGPRLDRSKAQFTPKLNRRNAHAGYSSTVNVIPSVIIDYYGLQDVPANSGYVQAIAAFNDYYSAGALAQFEQNHNLSAANITASGGDCLSSGCDQYESDLDIQYITSVGSGLPTIFYNTNDGWVLEWGQALNNMTSPASIYSVSYGWTEDEQCDIDPHGCNNLSNNQYINRTEIELQKLAARGVTILIAAGDDGAPEYGGGGGNCPIDSSIYCIAGGCDHSSTQCGSVLITDSNGNTCQWPMGISGDGCSVVLKEKPHRKDYFDLWFSDNANAGCGVSIEKDDQFTKWLYSNCSCSDLTYGQYDGFTISEYSYDRSNGAPFTPDYPASSAFVLSIGATQFSGDQNSIDGEMVCSVQTGAIITGGGGFSNVIPTPSWQAAAVQTWISAYGSYIPNGYFNGNGRAYPDLTLVGHNFEVEYSNNQQDLDECPCTSGQFDGTSASTPSSAGLLSKINQLLHASNLGPLGFLNPLLYTLDSSSFNDITEGNNNCNRAYCCQFGYTAVAGFDPASGLGSINWPNLAKGIVEARQSAKERRDALGL